MNAQFRLLVQTAKLALRHNVQDLAAAIAFWAFFSIFPLMIGVIALAGHFLESGEIQTQVLETIVELFPGSAALVEKNIEVVMDRRGALSWIAIVGLIWSSGKGFGAVTRAINKTLEAESSLPFFLGAARHFLMALIFAVMVTMAMGLPVIIEVVLKPSVMAKLGLEGTSLPRLEGWALSFVMIFLVFSLIYRLAPYIKVGWGDVWPGALLAAVAFEIGKTAFVLYLDRFSQFESVYGPLTSIIVLLLWLYVSALILIIGAEFNITRWQAKNPAPVES